MSRHGRSHRGRRGRKKLPLKEGYRLHRDKIKRRKTARDERQLKIKEILKKIRPVLPWCKLGVACSVWGRGTLTLGRRGAYFVNENGALKIKQTDMGPRAIQHKCWEELDNRSIDSILKREEWEPYAPKTALEMLAEAAK